MKTLQIFQSEGCNPREDDNVGIIAYKHRNYTLGEEEIADPIDWLEEKLNVKKQYVYNNERLEELSQLFTEKYVALPLYLYDHSGLSISTSPFSCRWDSGRVGFIYTTPERIKAQLGGQRVSAKKRARALEILQAEVDIFDSYLRGEVYGFTITEDDQEIDSCSGYYGDHDESGIVDEIAYHFPEMSREELLQMINTTEITY